MTGTVSAPGRLRSSADIRAVFAARRSRAGRFVVVHGRARGDDEHSRVAVVASRRVGGAVQRNRAKRLLREATRSVAWAPGHDVVLTARADCVAAHVRAVTDDLRATAERLGLVEDACS